MRGSGRTQQWKIPMDNGSNSAQPDYYKLFQIEPEASQMDIINAYRHAKLAYHADSLAIYSLYSEEEVEAIVAEIEEGYRVLSDPARRREYDAMLSGSDPGDAKDDEQENLAAQTARMENIVHLHRPSSGEPVRLLSYRGAALRKFREERGIALDFVAERTKISKRYLKAIEDEDRSNFPEAVYLKGYLRQYCREIGIDSEQAIHAYLERLQLSE